MKNRTILQTSLSVILGLVFLGVAFLWKGTDESSPSSPPSAQESPDEDVVSPIEAGVAKLQRGMTREQAQPIIEEMGYGDPVRWYSYVNIPGPQMGGLDGYSHRDTDDTLFIDWVGTNGVEVIDVVAVYDPEIHGVLIGYEGDFELVYKVIRKARREQYSVEDFVVAPEIEAGLVKLRLGMTKEQAYPIIEEMGFDVTFIGMETFLIPGYSAGSLPEGKSLTGGDECYSHIEDDYLLCAYWDIDYENEQVVLGDFALHNPSLYGNLPYDKKHDWVIVGCEQEEARENREMVGGKRDAGLDRLHKGMSREQAEPIIEEMGYGDPDRWYPYVSSPGLQVRGIVKYPHRDNGDTLFVDWVEANGVEVIGVVAVFEPEIHGVHTWKYGRGFEHVVKVLRAERGKQYSVDDFVVTPEIEAGLAKLRLGMTKEQVYSIITGIGFDVTFPFESVCCVAHPVGTPPEIRELKGGTDGYGHREGDYLLFADWYVDFEKEEVVLTGYALHNPELYGDLPGDKAHDWPIVECELEEARENRAKVRAGR